MRSTSGISARVVLLIWCLVCRSGLAYGQSAITTVQLNFGSASFATTVPFDEEFSIAGTAPSAVRFVRVFYSEAAKDLPACRDAFADPVKTTASGPFDFKSPTAVTAIDVRITRALEAERRYVFLICTRGPLGDPVVTAFRQHAISTVDTTIQGIHVRAIDEKVARILRENLCKELEKLAAADQVLAAGSLFDCTVEDPERLRRFTDVLSDVLTPQFNAELALPVDVSVRVVDTLSRALQAIGASGALDALIAALPTSSNTTLASIPTTERNAVSLTEISNSVEAQQLAEGRRPAVTVSAPSEARRDAKVAAEVALNYQRTSTDLQALHKVLATLVGSQRDVEFLQQSLPAPLSAEVIATLQGLIAEPTADPCAVATLSPLRCAIMQAEDLRARHDRVARLLPERRKALDALGALIDIEALGVTVVRTTTVQDAETARSNYVSADAGFLILPWVRAASTYVATNIYFRPINPRASLASFGGWRRRTALTVGVTLNTLVDEEQTRFDLFNTQNLVLGLGFRFTEALRLTGGAVMFKEASPNPFDRRKSVAFSPYLSFSIDLNLALKTRGFGDAFKDLR